MRGSLAIAITTNNIADLQQCCNATERMSTLLERHEPTIAGKPFARKNRPSSAHVSPLLIFATS